MSVILWPGLNRVGPANENIRGGGALMIEVDPPDRASLNEAPQRLSWSAVENAGSYQVTLYDFESTPIWQSAPVRDTVVVIPESIRQSLRRDQPIYWRIGVERGIERIQSGLFRFEIRAR
jgi:hypothetical protein